MCNHNANLLTSGLRPQKSNPCCLVHTPRAGSISDRALPRLVPNQSPPEGYYAENLTAVISTVCDQYRDLLTAEESRFAESTLTLSTSALRLFARLLSRTKSYIRLDSLVYEDVDDVSKALEELSKARLISINAEGDSTEILSLLTVADLKATFIHIDLKGRKSERVDTILTEHDDEAIRDRVSKSYPWLLVSATKSFEFFCLLFFGNALQRLDEFVIRDLGVTRFEAYELDPAFRLFRTRRAIDRYLELSELAERVESLGKTVSAEDAKSIIHALEKREKDRVFELRRSRVLNALGRNLERVNEHDLALQCFRSSTAHPARERTMRILKKEGRTVEVERVRQDILNAPLSYEERAFALRFGRPRLPQQKVEIREGLAPITDAQRIESFAVQQLMAEGAQAWHLENSLPNGLFALAFWEWLYASVRGAFVNPFQASPLDLYWPEFFRVRQDICEDPLASPNELKTRILATAQHKLGISSHLVSWSTLTPSLLNSILDAMTIEQLEKLIRIVIEDLRQFRAGFPDLTVIDQNGDIAFVEVKGPGDQLRPNQRLWIERLTQAQFNVYVWRFH